MQPEQSPQTSPTSGARPRHPKAEESIPTPSESPQIRLAETKLRFPPRTFLEPLTAAELAASVLQHLIGRADREHLVVLYLDSRHRVTHAHRVSIGTATSTIVHPREVFKGACLANAIALIVGHNHPSGSVSPSEHDRLMTEQLKNAGDVLGIPVLDSLVVGPGKEFFSFVSGPGVVPHHLAARNLRGRIAPT